MPWDALPEHIDEPDEWDNKDDDDHWFTKWRKSFKGWFAYSYRSKHWWARWRAKPITLFALFGPGESRWENDIMAIRALNKPVWWYVPPKYGFYLSRVQYWTDRHFQIGWPLFVSFHFKYGRTGVIQFYAGAKRDGDCVYWFPAIFIGRGWK